MVGEIVSRASASNKSVRSCATIWICKPKMSRTHPDYIEIPRTAEHPGLRSDYLKEFEEFPEEEGIGEAERRGLISLPTIKLPAFEREDIPLTIIRPRAETPDFTDLSADGMASSTRRAQQHVVADWYRDG